MIEIGDSLLNVLHKDAEKFLEDEYINDKILEDKTLEQIKEEYNFDEINDASHDGKIPPQFEFFFWW